MSSPRHLLHAIVFLTLAAQWLTATAAETGINVPDDPTLEKALWQAFEAQGPGYQPRTEHFASDGTPRYINRLIREASPYLLQHAHNPVNWFPWGEEAFALASRDNKPIFLSIGYATCHWCHVMERESFENEGIASYLNKHFVAIKVDREQLPDVDSTYMTAVQLLTGSGGWPLSAFLNPMAQPFYGGTYFPPATFSDLLQRITTVWQEQHEALNEEAANISRALQNAVSMSTKIKELGASDLQTAINRLLTSHDELQGGFGNAPKFPREPALLFLLHEALRQDDAKVLKVADFTLERIAAGGIHDHVGGGFHRYAVDNDWLVPHFEKMLYNQAGLALAYSKAWDLAGNAEHSRVARRALDYVLREMRTDDGLFYSATDADSDGGEGLYFTWTPEEIGGVLSNTNASLAKNIWNITEQGNFEHRNIIHLEGPIHDVAKDVGLTPISLTARLDDISEQLLTARMKRVPPVLDDKIITAWNGLMIKALATAGDLFDEARYIKAARAAADSLIAGSIQADGTLRRARFQNRWSIPGTQSDYAFLAEGLLALYDVTDNNSYLARAVQLVQRMHELFWDNDQGGYFIGEQTVKGAALPIRPKDLHDNALPSGNASAARVLVHLWHRTGNDKYHERALALFDAFSESISEWPSNFTYMLIALSELLHQESGHRHYAARGKVKISGKIDTEGLIIRMQIAEGWHINANKPLQDYLVGTSVRQYSGQPISNVVYPAPTIATLGFQRSELALYTNTIELNIPANEVTELKVSDKSNSKLIPLVVDIQACNDEVCLAPESILLMLSQVNRVD